jgi:tetratricopeptide (TPR) repeat protein
MRTEQSCTRRAGAILLAVVVGVGVAAGRTSAAGSDGGAAVSQEAVAPAPVTAQKHDSEVAQALARIDAELAVQHWAVALVQVREFERQHSPVPAVDFRAARAWFGLGQVLGKSTIRQITDGRVGQFSGNYLLVEERGPDRYLCCTSDSALFRLRRAMDAGFDEPAAHLLHARIWQALGKPELALSLAKAHECAILGSAQPDDLSALAEIALQADSPDDDLRYIRLRAEREPQQADQILAQAYVELADYYSHRGDRDLEREFCYRAARLRPDDADLALRLADAEWQAQHYEPAARHYLQYLQNSPAQDSQRERVLERLATSFVNTTAP